jgi:hypothetical protein
MTRGTKHYSHLQLALVFFYICWGIPQFFDKYEILTPYLNQWFFSVVFTGITGCLVPILLKNKYKITYSMKSQTLHHYIIGLVFLAISLIVGIVFSGAFIQTTTLGYTLDIVLKYVLLFFPMSLGISLYAFLLLPRVIDTFLAYKINNVLITSLVTACFFFIGFFIDSTFGNLKLACTLALLGLLFSLSHWFTKKFWISFFGLFITILFNTMAEHKYVNYPFVIVIASTSISVLIIVLDGITHKSVQNKA